MNEKDFLHKVRARLDEESDHLDAATLSKLNQARQAALSQLNPQTLRKRKSWMPATGLVAAILLTSVFLFRTEEIITASDQGIDDIEIIAASDDLELYEQLDFYIWIAEDGKHAG